MKKRMISWLLAVCMVLTLLPAEALAADGTLDTGTTKAVTNSGTCGENLTWELSDDGTLTIRGTGEMNNYSDYGNTSPWYGYSANIQNVVLEQGVTRIGSDAFASCRSLTSITIPDSVTSIGHEAFWGCSGLTSVTIPDSVTHMDRYVFQGCSGLTSAGPLDGDYSIKFGWTKEIPNSAFYYSEITSVTIPESVTRIGHEAFADSAIETITIPNGVASIGYWAFGDCNSLISIAIPASVTDIQECVFGRSSKLRNIVVDAENPNYCSIDDVLFDKNQTTLIAYPGGKEGEYYKVPDTVKRIGSWAFPNYRLRNIDLPSGLTDIGAYAFDGTNITAIEIPGSMTAIPSCAFSGTGITSIVIPEGVKTIGDQAFVNCSQLASVTLPESLTTIESSAFGGCYSLESITIPAKVTSITYPFRSCTNLTEIIVAKNNPAYCSIDGVLFTKDMTTLVAYPAGKSGTTYKIPDSITEISYGAFAMNRLTTIDIPKGVKTIRSSAFEYSTLTSLKIPSGVTKLEYSLFWNCSQLSSVEIPDSVTRISEDVFGGCPETLVISCYAGSAIMEYAVKKNISYKIIEKPSRKLTVSVLSPDEEAITDHFTVTWYNEAGEETGSGSELSGADLDKSYSFEITLTGDLAKRYQQPERQTIAPEDDAECTVRLVEIKTLTLSGRVTAQDGAAIQNAAVTITPAGGDAVEVTTGADGGFRAEVPYCVVSVAIRVDGYYSKRETLDLTNENGDDYDAGTYTLAPVQVITDRVTLSVTQRRAAEEPDGAMELPLSSLGAMEVSVEGKDSADFEVQGLALVFKPGAVRAGEELTITITDPSGAYCAASATVELDGNRLGSAEMTMVQKGSLVLGGVSGPSANLLLFDGNGNCILTRAAEPGLSSGTLEAGSYRAVLIQKSELLRGVSKLNYLGTFGLNAGSDYLLKEAAIADGKITRLADCAVPALDEGRISYTVAEHTGVSTSKPSGISVGEMLMVRAAYELDKTKGAAVDSLQIVLPEGVSLTGTSATIDGKTAAYTYDAAKREVKISTTGRDKAVVWLCCTPETSGSHSISAFLKLSNGASQPIGAAVVQAENAKLNVPERTGKAEGLTASGRTMPGCTVTLYDNDEEVGTATANAAGSWSMSFNLAAPVYSYSYHDIYAVISGGNLTKPIQTESVLVTYDKRLNVELTKITMYNTGDHGAQETVFDFTNTSTAAPYYRMWPSRYPTFTFKAEFSGDASSLSDVYVVTTNSAGDKTYVKTKYDAVSGAWVGTRDYSTFSSAPAAVTAEYSLGDLGEIPFDEEMIAEMTTDIFESSVKAEAEAEKAFTGIVNFENLVVQDDSMEVALTYKDSSTNDSIVFGTYRIEIASIDGNVTADDLIDDGYSILHDNPQILGIITFTDTAIIQTCVNLSESTCLTMTTSIDTTQQAVLMSRLGANWEGALLEITKRTLTLCAIAGIIAAVVSFASPALLVSPYIVYLSAVGAGGTALGSFVGFWETNYKNRTWLNMLTVRQEIFERDLLTLKAQLEVLCKEDGKRRVPDTEYYKLKADVAELESEIAIYADTSRELIKFSGVLLGVMSAINGLLSIFDKVGVNAKEVSNLSPAERGIYEQLVRAKGMLSLELGGENIGDNIIRDKAVIEAEQYIRETGNQLTQKMQLLSNQIVKSYRKCDNAPSEDTVPVSLQENKQQPSSRPVTYIADPSGYVYEAVPSNRLEGVTAVISEKDGGSQWNAAAYDQINPQVTGADGGYYWDVPQGNWKVSFTKAGYENADTSSVSAAVGGWLPVPPPQLEVNVGMVSTAAPSVKQAAVYTDRVEVEFSQYMDIASVQGALSLTQGGAALSGCTVAALNAESNLENTAQYATRFAITPSDTGVLSNGLAVSVSTGAKNYAGKPLASAYTSETLRGSVRPTGIEAVDAVSVGLHKEVSLTLTLQPNVAARELVIENLSPNLIGTAATVTTGADGTAAVSIAGILPGSGMIQITEPVSGLSTTVAVNVSFDGAGEEVSVLPVEAVLSDGRTVTDGMTVPRNAEITLRTNTPGAAIRYTLNDTCPCTQEALTYSGPITIGGSTVLRAAAYKNGVYSATIRLQLNVEDSGGTHIHSWAASWSSDANGHWHNCTAANCPITTNSGKNAYAAHTSDGGVVTTPATSSAAGVKTFSCTVCKYVIKTETIPAAGGSSSGGGTGSSGATTYKVTVPANIPNGTVTLDNTSARRGDTVTITATPDSGYKLDSLTVTDAKGSEVRLTDKGDGKFTFTMPASRVTVKAKFAKAPVMNFTDISSSAYYYNAVAWAVEKGVTVGTSAATFSPDAPCTRAQIVTFLWRAAGSPKAEGQNPFTDVAPGSYYYDAVLWAVSKGITVGTNADTFSPDTTCTRGQAVTFLYRYEKSPAVSGGNTFTDINANAYYTDAVQWAVNNGVTAGTSATTFSPSTTCTRGQIVTFLYRDMA